MQALVQGCEDDRSVRRFQFPRSGKRSATQPSSATVCSTRVDCPSSRVWRCLLNAVCSTDPIRSACHKMPVMSTMQLSLNVFNDVFNDVDLLPLLAPLLTLGDGNLLAVCCKSMKASTEKACPRRSPACTQGTTLHHGTPRASSGASTTLKTWTSTSSSSFSFSCSSRRGQAWCA